MTRRETLVVGGLTPFTTIDFPGRLAAVIFCQGCPWRCAYCHNPHLLSPQGTTTQSWDAVMNWLMTRRGLLDGVVFSGGEPLLQRRLATAIGEVRAMGFAAALHTAGAYPQRLHALLPLLDWVGFDVKAPFDGYRPITGSDGGETARKSLDILIASGTPHEVRCTVDESLLTVGDLGRMVKQLTAAGVSRLVLQPRRNDQGQTLALTPRLREYLSLHLDNVQLRQS